CPPQAPFWFSHAFQEMTKIGLGPDFNAVLVAWTRIEKASKWENPTGHSLPAKGRPQVILQWIGAARGTRGGDAPMVTNPAAYEVEWWSWWKSLQPDWRRVERD
ncbi:hypothetical protein C8R46DRAFT_853011, partial [Mycena filopes]